MIENVYCIYDRAASIALKPLLTSRNDVVPLREFKQIANNPESIVHNHPQDFDLMHIGTVNLEAALIEHSPSRIVVNAAELKDPK